LNLERFFIYSGAVHALILAVIIFTMPAAKKIQKGEELMASLVSPKELLSPQAPPVPSGRSAPSAPRIFSRGHARIPALKESRSTRIERQPLPHDTTGSSGGLTENRNYPPPGPGSTGQSGSQGDTGKAPGTGEAATKPQAAGPTLRDKLFDKGILNEFAKRENAEEKKNKSRDFTFDTDEYRYLLYNRRLKERIEHIWQYPPEAASQGIYGDLVIRFTIKKNGKLGAVELMRTSGHRNLDEAAMKALKEGEPYWPLPDEWGMDGYTITGHFIYTLYGYYVM
jgi:TonB family protein